MHNHTIFGESSWLHAVILFNERHLLAGVIMLMLLAWSRNDTNTSLLSGKK